MIWNNVCDHIDKKTKQLLAASMSLSLGYGGGVVVREITGLRPEKIKLGIEQITGKKPLDSEYSRYAAGGRKTVSEIYPDVEASILKMVEEDTQDDPESPLLWTSRSLLNIRNALLEEGISISDGIACILLFNASKRSRLKHVYDIAKRTVDMELSNLELEVERLRAIFKDRKQDELLTIYEDVNYISKNRLKSVMENIGTFETLVFAFPDDYNCWELVTSSGTFWNAKENRVDAMYWMMDKLGKMYVTAKDFKYFGLVSLLRHYETPKAENALRDVLHVPTGGSFMKFIVLYQSKFGLSDDELADKAGISKETYKGWKAGHYKPSCMAIVKMCDGLKINLRKSAHDSFEAAIKDLKPHWQKTEDFNSGV